ncbi:phage antirepressor N-terminal domain-containing protein [Pseudomonas sp. RGB]|uniref:phage antirepressor N-terminal domain-containing protein n=1 Tax=Pseudomonas sp. RGB TaxID=2598474 RepID=UPI0021151215|nr:phage antirepressor N-terminal domain-containing protein [Pseudomonas sp. RGB]
MQNQMMPVPFYEDTVVLVGRDNEPMVAMRAIVNNMGMDWPTQYVKLTEKFSSTVGEIPTVGEDGKMRGMVCLPLRKLPAWLYSISPNKVKPELRYKITRYQEECDDALWDYWSKGSVTRFAALNVSQQIALSRHRVALLKELYRTRDAGVRAALHEQLAHTSLQLGLSVPELKTIGNADPLPDACLKSLWDALEILDRRGERYNHAPWLSGKIYLKLPHLEVLFKKNGIKLIFDAKMRHAMKLSTQPKFVSTGPKGSSIEDKTIRCWIFEGPLKTEPAILNLSSI